MSRSLHERARRIRERAAVRSWEYRQREHANGAWYRLRRVLVDASQAWIIEEPDADCLEREGHTPLPVGQELEPAKRLYFLTERELESLPSRRQVPVRLTAELLEARSLALLAHDPGLRPPRPGPGG